MFKKRNKNRRKILNSDLGRRKGKKGRKKGGAFKKFFLKALFYIFLLSFLFGVPYFVFVRDFLNVKQFNVYGNQKISEVQIQENLKRIKSDKWLGFIPKNNIIFPWGKMIKTDLYSKYPIFVKMKIKRTFPDTINVFFEEREPRLILGSKEGNCVYDENGEKFDFSKNFSYLGNDKIDAITLLDGNLFERCLPNIDKDYIGFLFDIRKLLKENLEIELSNFWETPNLASGDLRIETKLEWNILLDENLGAEKEFQMLKLVLNEKIDEETLKNLEYIDLRTQNRIYYKAGEKNEEEKTEEDDGNKGNKEDRKED